MERLKALMDQAMELPCLKMAVVDAGERHVMEGVAEAVKHGLIDPVFIGVRHRFFYPSC